MPFHTWTRSKQFNHSHPPEWVTEKEKVGKEWREKERRWKEAMWGCLGRRWLENKNERTYSISEGSQCMELWPFTVSTSLYFKTHPFERDSHQGPQAIPDHHQNPYFSGHKRGEAGSLGASWSGAQVSRCRHPNLCPWNRSRKLRWALGAHEEICVVYFVIKAPPPPLPGIFTPVCVPTVFPQINLWLADRKTWAHEPRVETHSHTRARLERGHNQTVCPPAGWSWPVPL